MIFGIRLPNFIWQVNLHLRYTRAFQLNSTVKANINYYFIQKYIKI